MASIGDLVVNLTADSTKMNAALASARKQLMTFGAAVAAAAGAAVTRFLQVGSSLDDMAQRTGVSVEALSGLAYAAKLSDTDLQSLQGSLVKMTKLLGEAQGGSTAAADALAGIGLSSKQLQGLSPDEQFGRIADKIAAIQDPAAKTKAAMDVFGKSAAEILPLLNQGSDGIAEMMEEARQLGLVMDSETATAAATAADSIDRLLMAVDATAVKIGAMFAPILTSVAETMARFVGSNQTLVKVLAAAAVGLAAFAGALKLTTLATQAYSKAKAIALALSGPKGWLVLAGATVAAGVAVAALTMQFNGVNAEMQQAQKNAAAAAGAMQNVQGAIQPQAKNPKSAEARTERLQQFQQQAFTYYSSTSEGQLAKLQSDLQQAEKDFQELQKAGKATMNPEQFAQYKRAAIDAFTGIGTRIQEVTTELAILRGQTTEQEQELQRMARAGASEKQLAQLRAMIEERDRIVARQAYENELIQEAADKLKTMQDEAAAIKVSLETPEQTLQKQIERIQELQKAGLLTAEESAAAIAKTQQETQAGAQDTGVKFAGAMQRGSQEAYSAIIQAMGQRDNPQVKAIQAMDKNLGGKLEKIAGKKETKLEVVESIG